MRSMESRYGILIAVAILAFAVLLPMADADAGDSGYFSYKTQLDENGLLVYKEVANATTVNDPSKEFTVEFSNLMFYGYETEEKAKAYANHTVQNALAAAYYSNPMVAYLWDYPVKQIEINTTVEKVDVTSDTGTNTYYRAVKVTFTLTVPEGITSDSMKELDEAIKSFTVTGDTDADKVTNIMSYLDKLVYQKDEEGKISNIYSALVLKKTTSAGIAQAFLQYCVLNNIPAIMVAGDNITASDETKSFWNYVYLEGDHDGETYYSWYIVDPTYNVSAGICGYQTMIEYDGNSYSMSAALVTDLDLSSDNDLTTPQVNDKKYMRVGGPTFLEMHGEKVMLAALGVVLVVGMLYAVRSGNF